jgi:polyhydroxybutyrate depolymerase
MLLRRAAVCLSLVALSCSSSGSDPQATTDAGDDTGEERMFGGDRPVSVRVPDGYDPKKPAPLLLMLHGYGSAGGIFDIYLKMASIADKYGFFYVAPDGLVDSKGSHYWNATDACCDEDHTGVDDVAYLTGLVKEIQSVYAIDPARIYAFGHSNGGFMAHRLACDHAEMFAAIGSFAGAVWSDPTKCNPSTKVGVLQIHGTDDKEVLYAGHSGPIPPSTLSGTYPGAEQTVAFWAGKNGCAAALTSGGPNIHVDLDFKTNETVVTQHEGCAANGAAELWTVQGAGHIFAFAPEGLESLWKFFEDHPKPTR